MRAAVASGDSSVAPAITEESKVKLGGSDLKVTKLGIGVWSWGDNSYWNDFQWDGLSKYNLVLDFSSLLVL